MVTWEQIVSLPEYQQASPEKQAKVRELYLGMVSRKVGQAKDVMGGKVVTEASKASQEQAKQEQAVSRKAGAQMASMRQKGVKVPEEEALRTPVYDPVDLVIDASTGFMGSAGKAALKAGGKALMKNVAREVGTGAMAGAGMALADKAGAGAVGQLAAGLGGGVVGSAALTGSRKLIASMMKRGMPESQAARIVGEMTPDAVEKAVKAIEPTPGRIGKQTPIKRVGIAQAADASRLADDVTVHPEAEDYADMMAGYTPKQGRQGIPPVDAQGRRLQAVTERYRYQQTPQEGPFGVEDTLKPVAKVEPVVKPKPSEVDPFLEQTGGFVPEEGVDVGRRIAIPEGVRHLPEGVTRGEDGKLYISIAPAKRTVKVVPEVAQAVPEVAPKVEAPARKQPWEMTGDDFATLHLWADAHPNRTKELGWGDWDKEALDLQVRGLANGDSILEDDLSRAFWTNPRERDAAHRVFVKKALSEGKPVPPEVLAEYPDLAPKPGIGPSVPKAEAGRPKELWEMTKAEAVGEEPTPPSSIKALPSIKLMYGTTGPNPAQLADYKAKASQINSLKRKALKEYPEYVKKSNAHLASIQQALKEGKPVPDEVLSDYSWLERPAGIGPSTPKVAVGTEYPTLHRHTKGEIEQLIEEETDKLVAEIPRLPRHRAKEIAGARLVTRYADEYDGLRKAIRAGDHRPEILALDEEATFYPHNINEQVVDLTGTRTLLLDKDVTNADLAEQFKHGDAIPDVKPSTYYMKRDFPEPFHSYVTPKDSDGMPVKVDATLYNDIAVHKSLNGKGYTVRVGENVIADGVGRKKATEVAKEFWDKRLAQAEYPDLAPKVEAPAGKPELVGYEWRNTNGERFRAWNGEAVPAKVSDWSRHEVSAGSGKDIVHVYWIKDVDGTVKPYGKQTALKKLGMGERKLQGALDNITRKENETKYTLKNWAEWATSDPNEARNLFASRNKNTNVRMSEGVFYEKDGKYIITIPSEFTDEIARNAGYKKVGPANKLPRPADLAPKVEAPSGIAPSVPKASMSDPGGIGIVSDEYLGKVPQPIRRFFGGIFEYRYGQPEAYKEIAEGALNTTAYVSTQARKMVDSAKGLAQKLKVADSDVLNYLQGYTANVPKELAAELDTIRATIDKWGDEAVKATLLSPEKRKAGYLARLYERHLIDAYEPTLEARQGAINWLIQSKNAANEEEAESLIQSILEGNGVKLVNGPAIPAKLDMGRFMERQDVPYPIRQLLGEVSNPYYLAYRSINDVARDVTQVKMFKQIAENPLWASKSAKPGFVKINTATLPKGLSHALDVMKDKWGDVGGLYIKKEIADDLKKTYSVANEYAQMYGVLQSTWKMMKVPMNPATVTTNIISNSILCHLGGLPLWRQAVALPDAMMNVIRSRKGNMDPIYKALEDNHMFTGNYTENELGILYEGLSLAMNRTRNNALRLAYALQWAVKKAGGQKAADFYGAVEDTYKYMLAKDLMVRGRGATVQDMVKGRFGRTKLTPEEAVKETELWLFNYRQLPEPLKALRRTVVPFISWPYFSGKAMGRAVLNYPHRVLPILALGYAIDDKMKDQGKDVKLSKYLPYFDTMSEDWQTLGGIPVPPNLQPGGVAVSLFEGWLGRSLHGGRDIFSSDDPDEVKAQKQREYFWNTYTPPMLGYSGKRLLDAATGQPKNRYGDVEDVGTAMAGSLAGVQIRPDDRVTHYREIKRLMGKIEQEKNYLKWYLKQGYSEADKRERLDLARQRIAEFTKQRDEAVKAYQSARK